mmetsp:Transcript_29514/g.84297  ORF Transcript_29514/g.84297 Transcript_29514/m.84297 type:complete len:200 (+) Transcript_29514:849-1448(+)
MDGCGWDAPKVAGPFVVGGEDRLHQFLLRLRRRVHRLIYHDEGGTGASGQPLRRLWHFQPAGRWRHRRVHSVPDGQEPVQQLRGVLPVRRRHVRSLAGAGGVRPLPRGLGRGVLGRPGVRQLHGGPGGRGAGPQSLPGLRAGPVHGAGGPVGVRQLSGGQVPAGGGPERVPAVHRLRRLRDDHPVPGVHDVGAVHLLRG